ncbi:MAG: carboxylesterase family protein [Coxiellaceae bacterium]|nr:carboxylesterase family protein [Coxiellaceae bacterium]
MLCSKQVRMPFFLSIFILFILVFASIQANSRPACSSSAPIAKLAKTAVCGVQQKRYGQSAYAYLGIPFAQPPVGKLRWKPPVKDVQWNTKLYRATEVQNKCVQPSGKSFAGSEDCLYLNIWRPKNTGKQALPVMVFIPGGGFLLGQGGLPVYNGTYMASTGHVIVVTLSYRLGSLGFLRYLGHGSKMNGNFALEDQLAALQWVHKNIQHFNGDASKVTIFGESAGAMSVGLHLFSIPASHSLFRAAIMESNVMGVPYASAKKASQRGKSYIKELCKLSGDKKHKCPMTAAWLRSLPIKTIMDAENNMMPTGGMAGLLLNGMVDGAIWAPTIGVYPVTGQAYDGFHKGSTPKPYVFGFNRNEGDFFVPNPGHFTNKFFVSTLVKDFGKKTAKAIMDFKANGVRPYNPKSYHYNAGSGMTPAAQAMGNVLTDYAFATANIRSAEKALPFMKAASMPMHGYYFTQHSNFNYPGMKRCGPDSGNICHTEELPYVFHNFVKKEEILLPEKGILTQDIKLAVKMSRSWSGFAKDPMHWKKGWGYSPLTNVLKGDYVHWDTPVKTINNLPAIVHYDFWSSILNRENHIK